MWIRFLKLILGVLLIPFCFGTAIAFYREVSKISLNSLDKMIFLWGVILYMIIHLFLFKPQRVYIFGHEIVHLLFSWLSGGKIKKIKISNEGGEVKTDRLNFLTLISPYIFPIYPLIFSLLFFILDASYKLGFIYLRIFLFTLGFTLTMHILMTAETLRRIQPDLIKAGYFLSLTLIFLINISVIAFVLSRIFTHFSFSSFLNLSFTVTYSIFSRIFAQFFSI